MKPIKGLSQPWRLWSMLIAFSALVLVSPFEAKACTCEKLEAKYAKLTTKHAAAVAAGNALKASILQGRIVNFVKLNWKEIPGCPPPVLPPSWCPDPDGGGGGGGAAAFPGGRGHGLDGICLPGDTAFPRFFVRSADPAASKTVTVRVWADSLNPAGFTLLDSVFSVFLPALPDTSGIILDVPVEIVPLALVGERALFHASVEEADGRFWNEPLTTAITVSDVFVEPLDPIVEVPGSGGFLVGWRIFNPTASPIIKSYNSLLLPDAEAFVTLNNGTPYPIFNSYPMDKGASAGSVVVPAASGGVPGFVDVFCDMISNELCEPTMLGCKGLEIDGGLSIVATPNQADGLFAPPISSGGRDLVGTAMGGFVEIVLMFDGVTVPIGLPTFPGQPVEDIIDQLTFIIHNEYLNANGFSYQAAAIDNFIDVFGPPGGVFQFNSFDPGLNWQIPGCEPPGWMHPTFLPGDIAELQWIQPGNPPAQYQIQVQPLAGGPPLTFIAPGGANTFATPPLEPGLYTWQIQSICDPGLPIVSSFSYPDTFEIQPCNGGMPPVNLSSIVGPSAVDLSWDPVQGSTACQIEGTRLIPIGPTGKRNVVGLEPGSTNVPIAVLGEGSTWQWRVRCACNTSPVNPTPWSSLGVFAVPGPPAKEAEASAWQLAPNPARDRLRITLPEGRALPSIIHLVDATGVKWPLHAIGPGLGQHIDLDVSALPSGLYYLQHGQDLPERVVIMH